MRIVAFPSTVSVTSVGFADEPRLALLPLEPRRRHELQVAARQVVGHPLPVLAERVRARRVVVPQRRRLGDRPALEHPPVPLVGRPLPVRRLVVEHQEEGPVPRALADEVDPEVGDHVGDVAPGVGLLAGRGVEHGVVVDALAGQDLPAVEARRVAPEVPLADHAGVVAGGLEELRHRRLRAVEAVEDGDAVPVGVGAGQDRRPARRADRVRDEGVRGRASPPGPGGRGSGSR